MSTQTLQPPSNLNPPNNLTPEQHQTQQRLQAENKAAANARLLAIAENHLNNLERKKVVKITYGDSHVWK